MADEPVIIVDYDPAWAKAFERERGQIQAALGDAALAVEHIGSTAVPGLRAKPIIDILVAVERIGPAREYVPRLEALGYVYHPHDDDHVRLFFHKGAPQQYHLHIVAHGGEEHRRHVRFRDALRAHPGTAREYAALKDGLAARFRNQREAYTDGKTEFIRRVESEGGRE